MITTGAPNTAVTVLILSSVGDKIFLANKSQNRQNTLPPKKLAGIIMIGLLVLKSFLIRCGTAMPTKDIGPANATIHADRMLDNITMPTRKALVLTPIDDACESPMM